MYKGLGSLLPLLSCRASEASIPLHLKLTLRSPVELVGHRSPLIAIRQVRHGHVQAAQVGLVGEGGVGHAQGKEDVLAHQVLPRLST